MSRSVHSITGILCVIAIYLFPSSTLAALTGAEIVTKADELNGGRDSIEHLSFAIARPGKETRKLEYTMVWKEYAGRGDVDDKVIFFSEYPPNDKGKSFMIWVYADKKADEWMYLPALRMVRKMSHSEHHGHHDEQDDFTHSTLTHIELVPRAPALDKHTRLRDEELDGHGDYVVESVPKKKSKNYPYQKTRRWITRDNFLPERIDYYGSAGAPIKRQTIKWRKIGAAWVWQQVVGENLITGERTELDVSDVKLNSGLKDGVFTARTLRLGKDSIVY
jgi:hypothetical protein